MKKALLSIAMFTIANFLHAQMNFGIKAGVQQNLLRISSDNIGISMMGTGAHLGLVADYSVNENFSIQPNLLFQMKSVKQSEETSLSLYNVDIPVNFLYKQGGFFVGAGPNFSYGISGKAKTDGQDDTDLYEDPDGPVEAPLKRFEIGANFLMGYKFSNKLTLSAHYTPGFSNMYNDDDPDSPKYNTRIFGFSIGYMFK